MYIACFIFRYFRFYLTDVKLLASTITVAITVYRLHKAKTEMQCLNWFDCKKIRSTF